MKKQEQKQHLITAKTQTAADKDTPTIGMFEVPLDEDAVILRGTVSDGINSLANADVEIKVDDVTVNTTTGDSGTYSVTEGLKAGEATITVRTEGREDVSITVQLEAGKVNVGDVRVPLVPMPDEYEYEIFNETFDDGSSENFSFDQGSEITGGALVITKGHGKCFAAAVSYSARRSRLRRVWISALTIKQILQTKWDWSSGIPMEGSFRSLRGSAEGRTAYLCYRRCSG